MHRAGKEVNSPDQSFSQVNISTVRDFWDSRPCNLRHSPKPVGTREYFDEVEARKYLVEPHIPAFAAFPTWRGKKVLEIGCGLGTDTINFARAGAQVTAVDLSARSLALARQRAAAYGLEVQFYQADAEELTKVVPVQPYDLVYAFGVIHHTPHPRRAITELSHYLHRDSLLKLMVYHRHSWKVLWILLKYGKGAFWRLDDLVARHSEAQTGCPVTYTYSCQSVKRLLAGFRILSMQVDHIFPYKISAYTRYRYEKVWYFRGLPGPVFRWLERNWGWHLCVTAKLDRSFS
jgi:2-polyprenyl-3-methyl-5-hydroxy-6-metoxy-1,4-benzoquinol methylase